MLGISAALALLPALGAAIVMGLATAKAVEAAARQPEASSKVQVILLLGCALTESTAIYSFVIALILTTKI
ncbi:MAG: ATP synthase F0 subunit C [Clostridia bacterium]|nr:ATP synthase F0 subunit C [Clostridia bacterium]MBQ9880048.1 ATP synthase F0 subunit C [Clostridia bacterium]MCR5690050.1 ATP synthase F0 subunit C [Clostridiales bacterium]